MERFIALHLNPPNEREQTTSTEVVQGVYFALASIPCSSRTEEEQVSSAQNNLLKAVANTRQHNNGNASSAILTANPVIENEEYRHMLERFNRDVLTSPSVMYEPNPRIVAGLFKSIPDETMQKALLSLGALTPDDTLQDLLEGKCGGEVQELKSQDRYRKETVRKVSIRNLPVSIPFNDGQKVDVTLEIMHNYLPTLKESYWNVNVAINGSSTRDIISSQYQG